MVVHLIPPSIVGGSVAHKPRVRRYAYGSTEWAIRNAATAGKDGIDLDLTISADGTAWVNHWDRLLARDSWMDPEGLLPRTATIRTLTDAQLGRLRWRDPDGNLWSMLTARQAMQVCVEHGIVPCFEAKGDTGRDLFYRPDWWAGFKADADEVGIVPIIMSLPGGGKGARKLIAAATAGLVTMWIHRPGSTVPAVGVDLVKSWPRRPIHRVSIRQVGPTVFTPEEPVVTVRKAKAIELLFNEFNTRFPGRAKATDGWLGDAAHRSRTSDHNAWIVDGNDRVVSAADITEDNEGGIKEIVDWAIDLIVKRRDERIKYIIHEGRMLRSYDKPGIPAWTWSRYDGPNKHLVHGHFSVRSEKRYYDSTAPWGILQEKTEPKMNKVEQARAKFEEGLALLADVDKSRTHAHLMGDAVKQALVDGPKS